MSNRIDPRGTIRASWLSMPRATAFFSVLCVAPSCGVQEHPHEMATQTYVVVTVTSGTGGSGTASGASTSGSTAPTAGSATGAATGATSGAAAGAQSGSTTTGAVSTGMASTGGSAGGSAAGASGATGSGAGASGAATSGAASGTAASGTGASGTPSGVSIVINGTAVPKEKAIAYVHLGHSNMAGRGDSPMTSRPYFFMQPDPHAWMFHSTSQMLQGAPAPGFQPAAEPYTAGDTGNFQVQIPGQTLPLGGPGTAFVKESVALAPDYWFVSLGHAVGSAYCSQFLPGALYYDAVMASPKALVGKVTFGAIFIMLGITERHGTQADITGFPTCINTLVTAIRTDLNAPNLPLLISDYEMGATGALAPTSAFAQQIIPEIHKVPTTVSNSAIVPTDNLAMLPAPDDHHFNLEGHRTYAGRALTIMQQNGWFPWK